MELLSLFRLDTTCSNTLTSLCQGRSQGEGDEEIIAPRRTKRHRFEGHHSHATSMYTVGIR